jgi:hypothetical protein
MVKILGINPDFTFTGLAASIPPPGMRLLASSWAGIDQSGTIAVYV